MFCFSTPDGSAPHCSQTSHPRFWLGQSCLYSHHGRDTCSKLGTEPCVLPMPLKDSSIHIGPFAFLSDLFFFVSNNACYAQTVDLEEQILRRKVCHISISVFTRNPLQFIQRTSQSSDQMTVQIQSFAQPASQNWLAPVNKLTKGLLDWKIFIPYPANSPSQKLPTVIQQEYPMDSELHNKPSE